MVSLPKLPKRKPPLPPGLVYAEHNYPMTKAEYLRWLARKEKKGRR